MSIEWDSRSRNLESKIIAQHQSLYDEKKNKKKVIGGPAEFFSTSYQLKEKSSKLAASEATCCQVTDAYSWSYQGMMARS